MKLKLIVFFAFFLSFLTPCFLYAQDSLKLLNGKILDVSIQEVEKHTIHFIETYKGKATYRQRHTSTIFSYREQFKPEVIVYEYNPEIGNIYQIDEMKDYILGERHADRYYKSSPVTFISIATGATAGYFLAQGDLAFVAFPLVFSSILIIPGAKVKQNPYNEKYMKNNAYFEGYKRVAKSKKFFNGLKFSGLSMLASFGVFKLIE